MGDDKMAFHGLSILYKTVTILYLLHYKSNQNEISDLIQVNSNLIQLNSDLIQLTYNLFQVTFNIF